MVAARSCPEPVHDLTGTSPVPAGRSSELDRIGLLAARWAELSTAPDPCTAARLATALRRFAATLKAEPFWPHAARDVGVDLLSTGLCGDPGALAPDAVDVLAPSLGLLRRAGAAAFGLPGAEGEQRLAVALDELATGFARGLRERTRRELDDVLRAALRTREGVERERAVGETDYRTVYLQSAVGIGVASLDGRVLDVNPALGAMFGVDAPLDQPRPVSDFMHPDDVAGLVERYERLVHGESEVLRLDMRFIRPDGLVLWTRVVASLVRDADGAPTQLIAVVEDVSERHRSQSGLSQSGLQHASYQEQLAQLPNRSLTEQWLRRAFAGGANRRVGLCALDLDGFTPINDGLGHRAGDQLLLAVAGRLQMVAGRHLVTRTGGDEFAVLLADPEAGDVSRLADRVLSALATPFPVGGHSLTISASVGVAEAVTGAGCPEELMRAAAVALSWAKAHGGGRRVVFDPERDAGEAARFALLAGLRAGVDREEFRLAFQPLVRLSDGRVQGAEALVRWQHPAEGLIGPDRFIDFAEASGAIVPLGRWVLEAACIQAATWWRELGHADPGRPEAPGRAAPYVSVNVSPVQLAEPGWVDEVTGILAGTGLPPDRLQLEITEQAVLVDEAAALHALTALRGKGVRLALDDFGTGYSSLAWLRRLPVHALKIDGSFIDGLRHPDADPVDSSIVRALVEMAHALGLEVTAEWVETGVQSERLAALGCDVGQGRWFGDAGPAEWVPALWRRTIPRGGLRPPRAPRTTNR